MHLWLLPRIFGVTLGRTADPRSRALFFFFLERLRLLLRCRAASLLSAYRADTLLHFGETDYLGSSFHVSARETLLRLVSTVKRFSAVHFAFISTTAEFFQKTESLALRLAATGPLEVPAYSIWREISRDADISRLH